MNYYILDGHKIERVGLYQWAKWMKTTDRTIDKTQIGDSQVSTVFLGLDHQSGNGPPLLFETMIFDGKVDEYQWRYSTRQEAEDGHKAIVRCLEQGIEPDVVDTFPHCGASDSPTNGICSHR